MLSNEIDPRIQILRATVPARVFSTQNPDDETDEQMNMRINRFASLPKKIQGKLSSFEISKKIQKIGQKYNFDLLRLANVTRLVREYYFGEMPLENFPREIEKRMGVSLFTAQEISRYLKTEILDWDPWTEYVASLPKAPLRELLVKIPEIGDQLITEDEIEIKNFPEPLRPSVRNWLHDYTQHLGQDRHSSMQRMDYVFHSENTKKLSSPDREKLAIILRSFDDNEPLPFDQEKSEVLFDAVENKLEMPSSFPPGGVMMKKTEPAGNLAPIRFPPIHISSPNFTGQPGISSPPPKTQNINFIKPYPQNTPPIPAPSPPRAFTGMKPYIPPTPVRQSSAAAPNLSIQPPKKPKINVEPYKSPVQNAGAPQNRQDYSKPIPQPITQKQNPVQPGDIQYTSNPYPDPGTHEVHFGGQEQNIANVRFAEGAPRDGNIQGKMPAPLPPLIKRQKNIIHPLSGSESRLNIPDPRIEGNLVDLSGRTDQ